MSGVVVSVKPANKVVKKEPAEFKRRQATTFVVHPAGYCAKSSEKSSSQAVSQPCNCV